MKLAYFGDSARPLCGVHHSPRGATAQDEAVLLCYPGVQEYNASHWAFRRLAGLLSREGFHVLRFDWTGTGDSWGETVDGTVETWLEDVQMALQELREASGARSVSIVGMRLGAAIAALALTRGLAARVLVLWEPVIRGADYIADLESLDARDNLSLLHRMPPKRDELVGHPFPAELRRAIRQIDLVATPPRGAERVILVSSSERADLRRLGDGLRRAGVDSQRVTVSESQQPVNDNRRDSALLGNEAAVAITKVLAGSRSAA